MARWLRSKPAGSRTPFGVGPEHGADDLILLQKHPNGFGFVDANVLAAMAGILSERALEVLRYADVVHDQPRRLVAEDAVDAGDGLHQAVAFIGLSTYIVCIQGASIH